MPFEGETTFVVEFAIVIRGDEKLKAAVAHARFKLLEHVSIVIRSNAGQLVAMHSILHAKSFARRVTLVPLQLLPQ